MAAVGPLLSTVDTDSLRRLFCATASCVGGGCASSSSSFHTSSEPDLNGSPGAVVDPSSVVLFAVVGWGVCGSSTDVVDLDDDSATPWLFLDAHAPIPNFKEWKSALDSFRQLNFFSARLPSA
eukprot:Blabericola_migrator_1__3919@NODE_2185_length_3156_cov_92_176433_g69_i3_p5_GENE_NODE_2185_length_3156_cov_92_176433_g69_i3NODE_2185_length_3156_cov_92_176433_g69_i3_p5_ORF_typecomplete_len123_score20_29_NODE_2185_length_3156_cov_92_176433_g69_i3288656